MGVATLRRTQELCAQVWGLVCVCGRGWLCLVWGICGAVKPGLAMCKASNFLLMLYLVLCIVSTLVETFFVEISVLISHVVLTIFLNLKMIKLLYILETANWSNQLFQIFSSIVWLVLSIIWWYLLEHRSFSLWRHSTELFFIILSFWFPN